MLSNEPHRSAGEQLARAPLTSQLRAGRLYIATQWRRLFGLNVSQIDEQLYVGGQFRPEQWPRLYALGIRAVLSLQAEYEDQFHGTPPMRSLRLLVPDFHAPTLEQLHEATAFIAAAHAEALPVMIHCHAGVGRAPLTAAAHLIRSGHSTQQALARLQVARPIIALNATQLERLAEWERSHGELSAGAEQAAQARML
jgi:protein-tyrosine phosphatase